MVTWHQIGIIAGILIGALMLLPGGASVVRSMYATAPTGDRSGCRLGVLGIALIAASIAGLWL